MFYGEGEELPYNNIEELIPFFFNSFFFRTLGSPAVAFFL